MNNIIIDSPLSVYNFFKASYNVLKEDDYWPIYINTLTDCLVKKYDIELTPPGTHLIAGPAILIEDILEQPYIFYRLNPIGVDRVLERRQRTWRDGLYLIKQNKYYYVVSTRAFKKVLLQNNIWE